MSFIIVGTAIAVGGAALGAHSANKAKKQAIRSLDPWHNDVPASRG